MSEDRGFFRKDSSSSSAIHPLSGYSISSISLTVSGGYLNVGSTSNSFVRIFATTSANYYGFQVFNKNSTLMSHFGYAGPSVGSSLSGLTYFGSVSSIPVVITTSDTEKIRIDISGNVGIGTKAALSKLSINGGVHIGGDSDAGDDNLLVDGAITSSGLFNLSVANDAPVYLDSRNPAGSGLYVGEIRFRNYTDGSLVRYLEMGAVQNSANVEYLDWVLTRGRDAGRTELMRVTTDGNATFTGTLSAGAITSSGDMLVSKSTADYTHNGFKSINTSVNANSQASYQYKTGINSNVWQTFLRNNIFIVGIESVADLFTLTDAGNAIFAGTITSTGAVTSTQFKLSALNTAPANAGDTGTLGEIRIVDGYIYVCTATNTWKRAAIATWP